MTERTRAFRAGLLQAGTKPLIYDLKGQVRTSEDFVSVVDRLAGAMDAASTKHPKVGLWYTNSIAAVEAFLAVQWLGGTRVAVDPTASAEEAAAIFKAAKVDLVVADSEHAKLFGHTCLVHDDNAALEGSQLIPTDDVDLHCAYLIYPRAVVNGELFGISLSYANWYATMDAAINLFRSGVYGPWDEPSEVYLSSQQIMHGTGFVGTFPFLEMGLPQVIVDTFESKKVLDAINLHRVTATMCVPVMLNNLVGACCSNSNSVSSLRHVLYGGGPISSEEIFAAIETFGPVLNQIYGRVEGGWPLAILNVDDHAEFKAKPHLTASCGRATPGVDINFRSSAGQPEDVGELLVKSALTSAEYVGPDGWCALGDVMRRDDEGYLYYERRLDRMINTGYHVYPDEIEAALLSHVSVAKSLVVGEPHPRWGETVVAYIVPQKNQDPSDLEATLRTALEQKLAKYKVPREFRIVGELPEL